MRVLIAGSREYPRIDAVWAYVCRLDPGSVVIHGAARGVDDEAAWMAAQRGLEVISFPVTEADWRLLGRRARVIRNARMLYEGKPDAVVVFRDPASTGGSAGSQNMINLATKAGLPLTIVGPDGKEKESTVMGPGTIPVGAYRWTASAYAALVDEAWPPVMLDTVAMARAFACPDDTPPAPPMSTSAGWFAPVEEEEE